MNVSQRICSLFRQRKACFTTASARNASRVFAISDIHVDIRENLRFEENWSDNNYKNDVLIVAGDITDSVPLLKSTLQNIQTKFLKVFYVPGNHELWIRRDSYPDSIEKFYKILAMCAEIGVHTDPAKIQTATKDSESNEVWIVPLFSWYAKPEEDESDSLYAPGSRLLHEDRKFCEQGWMDNRLCKWDSLPKEMTPSQYFSALNADRLGQSYDAPIISFSHFLPRLELLLEDDVDHAEVKKFRDRHYMGEAPKFQGGIVGFNFSRYAGCKRLEKSIRKLGSCIHVHGHQHRNRDREVDGIRYVSHCLGSIKEQEEGWTWGMEEWKGPKQIWP